MVDYISRDAARAIIEEQQKAVCYTGRWGRGGAIDVEKYDALETVLDAIDAIPTADVAPVRHGHWIDCEDEYSSYVRCSVCGDEYTNWEADCAHTDFCPGCGADMRDGGTVLCSG